MTKLDADVELTLELARVAGEPSASDQQRVFEALATHLGLAAAPLPSVPLGSATPWWQGKAMLGRWLLVGAVAGGGGFWLGTARDSASRAEPPEVAVAVSQSVRGSDEESAPAAHPEGAVGPPSSGSSESTAPTVAPAEAQRAARSGGSSRTAPKLEARGAPQQTARAGPVRAAVSAQDAGAVRDRSFLDAVRLLQRAQRSIDAGEAAFAMALLDELDARFPRELLGEERRTARVLALCESGQTDRARQLADQLRAENPASIYMARIARSCVSLAD